MSDLKDEPVFPHLDLVSAVLQSHEALPIGGLTKREYFAGQCIQGLLMKKGEHEPEYFVAEALVYADALLAELEGER